MLLKLSEFIIKRMGERQVMEEQKKANTSILRAALAL
jgi:hypothetical protein